MNKKNQPTGIWASLDLMKLTLATTEKCFQDNRVIKGKGEINYTQFMQWMTGQSILGADELEAMEASNKPTKKSDFANRTFKNTQDFVQKFIQEEEFVDLVKEIQEDSLLSNVRLFVIMDEFLQYKKSNNINAEQFKKSVKKIISSEIKLQRKSEVTANEKIKIDSISKKLLKIFDCNKNGKLEYQEAVSAFSILCRGSV